MPEASGYWNTRNPGEDTDGIFEAWEHSGACYLAMAGGQKLMPRLAFPSEVKPTLLQIFELFFFTSFVKDVIILETNKRLINNGAHRELSYGGFLRWLGIWLLMGTINGPDRMDFWSIMETNRFRGAPFCLNDLMSKKQFEDILKSIFYTNQDALPYTDKFWEVRQMVDEWNSNMAVQFTPSWVSCLDESMSPWISKYTCPGWMFVPRKPHPLGNEYHTVCSISGILWGMELVEGKDAPRGRLIPYNN